MSYLTILVSYDGGVSFQIAAQFNATTPPFSGAANSFFDFNQLAFGGDGNGGWALYFVCDFVNTGSSVQVPCVGYIPVTGLGAIGSASLVAMNALAGVAKIPASIIVSDAGELFMNFNSALDNQHSTYSYYYLFHKTGGINGLIDGSLIGPNFWASINIGFGVGAYPGIGTNYSGINAKNIRGQQPMIPVRGLAYDNNKGILYALVYNHDPIYSQNSSLYLVASNDSGSSWSVPYYIKDNPLGNCFSASLTVDRITGNLFITWYDSRRDQPGNQYTQFYGTVVSSAQLDALIDTP